MNLCDAGIVNLEVFRLKEIIHDKNIVHQILVIRHPSSPSHSGNKLIIGLFTLLPNSSDVDVNFIILL